MKSSLLLLISVLFIPSSAYSQWTRQVSGMTNQSIGSLYADSSVVFAGSFTSVFKSTNFAGNWVSSSSGLPATTIFYSIVRSGTFLVAGGEGTGVWRSSDNGATWVQTTSGVSSNQYTHTFVADGNTVYAAFGNTPAIGISNDNGANWMKYSNGLPSNNTMTGIAKIGTILFGIHLSAGTYFSTDNGASWSLTAGVIGSQNLNSIIASGTALIVAGGGSGPQRSLNLSTDLGASWNVTRSGPLITGFSSDGAALYAVGDSIFRSIDQGATWVPIDKTGLTASVFNTIQFGGGYAFVNVNGLGVYRRLVSQIVSVGNTGGRVSSYHLFQNYPNPFNPTTKIVYQVGRREPVELKIYDVLGREVATLVNDVKNPGSYAVTFVASGLASGVYVYRLQTKEFAETKTMLLLR